MTYQDDPNGNIRRPLPASSETSYAGWVVGGVVAVAVVLGIFMMSGRTDRTDTAANPPATTGSSSTQKPAPATPAPAPVPAR
jgi:hypothetical protein